MFLADIPSTEQAQKMMGHVTEHAIKHWRKLQDDWDRDHPPGLAGAKTAGSA
jgi:hypothetical protein